MGEIAEMMLDGTLCACCGDFLGGDEGYPVYCGVCAPDFAPKPAEKTACKQCGKRVKLAGLADHQPDVHGITPTTGEHA